MKPALLFAAVLTSLLCGLHAQDGPLQPEWTSENGAEAYGMQCLCTQAHSPTVMHASFTHTDTIIYYSSAIADTIGTKLAVLYTNVTR